jgi:hypothetical protein
MPKTSSGGIGPCNRIPPLRADARALAMYYRTYLTLSALSNRLNLGTRSLVQATSVKHGNPILRIRHPYHDVMREAMVLDVVSPFKPVDYDIPCSSGSIVPGQEKRLLDKAGKVSSRSACQNPVNPEAEQRGRVSQPASGQCEPFFRPARRSPRSARASVLSLVLGRSPRQGACRGWRTGLAARPRAIAGALAPALCSAAAVTGV